MKRITTLLAIFALCCSISNAQEPKNKVGSLTVIIDNVKVGQGKLMIGIGDYKTAPQAMKGTLLDADSISKTAKFNNLSSGENPIWIFHDQNGNFNLDRDSSGKPKEGFAIEGSDNWQPKVIMSDRDTTINLRMKYTNLNSTK